MQKRNLVIDIAKGEILLFIILFHFLNSPADYFGNLFGLAALFIFSGYTTNYDKYSFKEYLLLKLKTLFAPAMIINTIFIIYDIFRKYLITFFMYGKISANDSLNSIIATAKTSLIDLFAHFEPYYLADPTWFLILLFFSCVFGKLIHDIIRKYNKDDKITSSKVLFIASIVLVLFYCLLYKDYSKINFYYLDIVPVACFFIATGQFFKQHKFNLKEITKIILFIISILFIYLCFKLEVGVNWYQKTFPNIIVMIAAAYAGTFAAVYFDQLRIRLAKKFDHEIKHTKIINKYAISIVLFHMFSLYVMDDVLRIAGVPDSTSLTTTVQKVLYAIVYILAGVVIPVGITKLFNAIKMDDEKEKPKKKKRTIKVKEDKIFNNKKFINMFENKKINYIIIILLIILNSCWMFKSYFVFNDWNTLALSFENYKTLLLQLDLGSIITKLIISVFNMNYVLYAILLILIHIINALLIYKIILKLTKDNKIAIGVSLLFGLNPITIQASYYFSNFTYLLGTTILLESIHLYLNDKKLITILLYLIIINLNKIFIFVPIIFFINELKNNNLRDKKIYIMILIMILGLIFNKYNFITIKNLINYVYLYFNPNSFIIDNNTYSYSYIIAVIAILAIVISYIIYNIKKKNYIPILLIVSSILFIIPINTVSSIYLYVPSIFISTFIIMFVFELLDTTLKNKSIIIILLLISILVLRVSEPVLTNNWLVKNTSNITKESYNYFEKINASNINIIDDSNYNLIGVTDDNNNLIKMAIKKNIKVTINDKNNEDALQIKYDNGKYKIVK